MLTPEQLEVEIDQWCRRTNEVNRSLGWLSRLLVGRLRQLPVRADVLTGLKRELRSWDSHKGRWK
jgi:hypothetical protein